MSTLERLYNTVGDYPIVYECVHAYDHYHREDDGCGDTRPAGKTRERTTVHIVAASQALAEAAWRHKYPAHVGYELVSCTALHTIDHTVVL